VSDQTAKAMGTVGIWIAVAVILALGVFRMNWNGDVAMLLMVVIVIVICGAAGVSTAAVWGWKPGKTTPEDRQRSP
jgi:hypothetical protein